MNTSNHSSTFTCDSVHNLEIFTIKDKVFTWGDVLTCAEFLGIVDEYWETLSASLAAVEFANQHELEPDTEELQSLANQLRYDLDLITTEETERWFTANELTLADFNHFLQRRAWLKNLSDKKDEIVKTIVNDPMSLS